MALMTGNAFTMTIPQLDKAIKNLQEKLNEKGIKGNETLTTKVNNLIYDYTKAKNKILRYYEKTKYKHPELVVGKKNTLRVIDIYKNKGNDKKAERLAKKEQKASYNVVDLMKDSKGLAIGLASTSVALGIANGISTAVAGKSIMTVLGEAVKTAFTTQPLTASLITAGLVIGGTALIVPKISRSVQKIKNHKTVSRQITNEALEASVDMSNIDFDKADIGEIKSIIKANPALKAHLEDMVNSGKLTPLQQSILNQAQAEISAEEVTAEREHKAAEGQTRLKTEKYDEYLNDYESLLTANGGVEVTEESITKLEDKIAENDNKIKEIESNLPKTAPIAIEKSESAYNAELTIITKELPKAKAKLTNLKKKSPLPTSDINKTEATINNLESRQKTIKTILVNYANAKKDYENYIKNHKEINNLKNENTTLTAELTSKKDALNKFKTAKQNLAKIGLDTPEKIEEALQNKELAGYAK